MRYLVIELGERTNIVDADTFTIDPNGTLAFWRHTPTGPVPAGHHTGWLRVSKLAQPISVPDAAHLVGVSVRTVRQWIKLDRVTQDADGLVHVEQCVEAKNRARPNVERLLGNA